MRRFAASDEIAGGGWAALLARGSSRAARKYDMSRGGDGGDGDGDGDGGGSGRGGVGWSDGCVLSSCPYVVSLAKYGRMCSCTPHPASCLTRPLTTAIHAHLCN